MIVAPQLEVSVFETWATIVTVAATAVMSTQGQIWDVKILRPRPA